MVGLGSGNCSFTALQWTVCRYIKKTQMPILKHSENLAALVAFHESKWCSRERDFAVLTRTSSINWVKTNQMLQENFQGKKKKASVALHIRQTGTFECRNHRAQQQKWINCVIFRCICQQEVISTGIGKLHDEIMVYGQTMMHAGCTTCSEMMIPSICLYFGRWNATYT